VSWVRASSVVFLKEVHEGFRDRRSVLTALFFPALGPALLVVLISIVSQTSREVDEKGVSIPVAGSQNAPNLVAFLAQGARVVSAPDDPEEAVRRGDADVVVVIPPDFGERLRSGRPAPIRLVVDESRDQARPAMRAAERLLGAWAHQTGAQRLMLRGVHPAVVEPLALEHVDVSTPASRLASLLATVPFFIVMAIFTGGMAIAIDTTAGERERQSLEPLFTLPVPRGVLVVGKVAATCVFGVLTLVETLLLFGLVPVALPASRIGFSVKLDPWMLARTVGLGLPMVLLASALMVLVAARARTFRSAQTTLSVLTLVPALPGIVLGLLRARPTDALLAVPFLGQQVLVTRMLRDEPVHFVQATIAGGATMALAGLVIAVAVRSFERGRPLFDQ
jgi:sodium transport system permease protein